MSRGSSEHNAAIPGSFERFRGGRREVSVWAIAMERLAKAEEILQKGASYLKLFEAEQAKLVATAVMEDKPEGEDESE